ncbi:MAG: DNA polymerase III subunit delta [Candidatus Kerfeldbacteria bacterium RIFOXYA2_FULL_38_24]|uniref:DNA polymerase III subunit delta n=1 Tax=Candidatus Kerfeldbacteria bacterium RIFOXYB2_FULL_38_14 TaxID=1798547 RepID=A0A1G2BG40_9BACT|nr:MAG: DNA polymerase III subunit delta [Candidatus Kerfeldbacteria bacterium RIFOXYB2_FULL_38_14]OGY88202.1 MAG: DNA polymerase III subunit delta [Candidatus Kerfeldbacteria bacterium RIFOXYA2_FULL_38_24]OGY89222.1 MAG: DNA polymerase III subunit delta [Candidatus Kerfeldbacteria bacterium RIFOXYC2_FULL_38_9]
MVIFLHGKNSYLRHQRMQKLKTAFCEKFDKQGVSVISLDADNFNLDDFRKYTKSGGLFTVKRFVVLKNIWALTKETQEQMLSEIDGVAVDTILCLNADEPPRKDNKLFKKLLQSEVVEMFGDLDHTKLQLFIKKECSVRQAKIDNEAAQKLINAFGNDLWSLSSEINKLANFSTVITKKIVEQFAQEQLDNDIFHLTDALGLKNSKQATILLEQQLKSGTNVQYLIVMLGRHLANLIKVKKTNGQGLKLHPFVLQKARQQIRYFSLKNLLGLYWRLLTIDHKSKTTNLNPWVLLEQLVVMACEKTNPLK